MKGYALDTNIVSYALKGQQKIREKMREVWDEGMAVVIPPMVYFEARRWLLRTGSAAKQRAFEDIYAHSGIAVIDKEQLDRAASLYAGLAKKGLTIDDADILIAVFCIDHDYTLVTNNTKHFAGLENLNIVNWLD